MSLDIIIAKVLDDARAEAGRILAEDRRKADELRTEEARRTEGQADAVRREAEQLRSVLPWLQRPPSERPPSRPWTNATTSWRRSLQL